MYIYICRYIPTPLKARVCTVFRHLQRPQGHEFHPRRRPKKRGQTTDISRFCGKAWFQLPGAPTSSHKRDRLELFDHAKQVQNPLGLGLKTLLICPPQKKQMSGRGCIYSPKPTVSDVARWATDPTNSALRRSAGKVGNAICAMSLEIDCILGFGISYV